MKLLHETKDETAPVRIIFHKEEIRALTRDPCKALPKSPVRASIREEHPVEPSRGIDSIRAIRK